jgi:hypothetical protein
MPNYSDRNPKQRIPAKALLKSEIIGYTPADAGLDKPQPTVYFTTGHLTIWHAVDWNVGWEDCAGWQPLFFGNVPQSEALARTFRSRDGNGALVPLATYLETLTQHGHNRIVGTPSTDPRSWDLQTRDDRPDATGLRTLRELWIRGEGARESDRYVHRARGPFVPIGAGDATERDEMWDHVQRFLDQATAARR